MTNKSSCPSNTRNEQHEDKDGEENNNGSCASTEIFNTCERCPICLNILTLEVGFPEECCHAFCVSCILKWSETSTSCPVDRKPFQAIYKTNSIGSWTKISVKERRPKDNLNCVCTETFTYCTKGKLCFRICIKEESDIITPQKENSCLDYKEKPEIEVMNLSWPNTFTGDSISTCPPFNLSETITPCFNNRREEEESELCLIRRKREALKLLRIPLGAEGDQCSTLPAELLIYQPSPLEEYILPLSPMPFKSKDYSNRMCAHTGAQDGTEKKQAASGTSTSRGTRKKSVQSSTRRRSTRNSKSDNSNLQSSPKSSSSDHDTPGSNTTTNISSSEHPGKQPSKQRKQAPKKGSQTRKRLRSATRSQEDSKEKEDSESEQEKKCKMSDNDSSETELCKVNQSPNNGNEKEYQHADLSSPCEHSVEKHLQDSSPAHSVHSLDNETMASPDLHQFHREHSSPSPVFKNGQTDLENSPADFTRSVNEPSDTDLAENQLSVKGKNSWESDNETASDGESSSSSPGSTKHIISDHTDLPHLACDKEEQFEIKESASSSSSCTEIESPRKLIQDLSSSEETDFNSENHLKPSQVNLQSDESHAEDMNSSSTQSTLQPELVQQYDLDCNQTPPDTLKDQSILKPPNINEPVSDESVKNEQRDDEPQIVLEENLQVEKQEDCPREPDAKTSMIFELNIQHNSENITELSQQSLAPSTNLTAEGLSDTGEIPGDGLSNEKVSSPLLGDGKIQDTDGEADSKNDHPKPFCEDNIEPVAMECDSLGSDHNDSEVEQAVDITEPPKTECEDLAAHKIPQSPPKQSLPSSDTHKKESRTRKSRFHSPSTTWSPSKNDKERPRSPSPPKVKDSPIKRKSRSRSRERDGERGHGGQWKGRSRDRHHRRHSRSRSRHSRSRSRHSRSRSRHSRSRSRHSRSRSRHSKSKSRSRSRSGSRTRHRNRSVTTDKNENDCSSPPWKERRSNENWKSPRGGEKYRRNEHDKHESFRNEKYDARDSDTYPDKNDYPDWVVEKMKSSGDSRGRGDTWMRTESRGRGDRGWGDARGRGDRARGRSDFRGRGDSRGRGDRGRGGNRGRGSHWEDGQYGSGDSWNRSVNMDWNSPRSRGGRGRGGFRGGFNYGDQNENWNNRQPYSGNSNTSGQESSRFPESKSKPKYEDSFEPRTDRSGWSSASSWAVRKTLPADVQNYYSKRGRNSTGSQGGGGAGVWPRQEETPDQDQASKEQGSQQTESAPVPVNMVQPQMNVVQQPIAAPPQPMNMFPYPVGVHPPLVNIQHNPYNLHPPLPIHLHPALPLVQVSAPSSVPQGLPPPPPPPPPSQQINYITPQQDGKPLQQGHPGAAYVSNNISAPLLPAPAAVQGTLGVVLGPNSGSVATTGHSKNLHTFVKSATRKESVTVEASADSSKKEKKIQIQERAAQEVKVAIKQYYQNKDITKDEYKEIVKKAVDKVCHSKSGEVDSAKVANLVKAYVDKYKHSRKKGTDDKL
ncbi:protein SCAF11 isoform 2-T2 [Leptodactylus fuscus]|uniref:protein SCAF11 isoform X2 n=1 Tax=Leptodactylus fuscus TaxID=238119 RepID=UPI003F4E7BBA